MILILIDGWGWKTSFDPTLPLLSRLTKDGGTIARPMDSGFPTTTAAMLPSLYLGQSPTDATGSSSGGITRSPSAR